MCGICGNKADAATLSWTIFVRWHSRALEVVRAFPPIAFPPSSTGTGVGIGPVSRRSRVQRHTPPAKPGSRSGAGAELETISVALDWYPNANHAGLFLAQERGYYAEEGLAPDFYTPSDPTTVLQTVGAGRDTFGISYQTDVLLARTAGVPVVSVLALVQTPLQGIMVLTDSGIDPAARPCWQDRRLSRHSEPGSVPGHDAGG